MSLFSDLRSHNNRKCAFVTKDAVLLKDAFASRRIAR